MKHLKRLRQGLVIIVLAFLAYVILGTTLPFLKHKEVSAQYRQQFKPEEFLADGPGTERAAFLKDNYEAFVWRLKMMEEAKEEIIMSTFDFDEDDAGLDVMAALIHAADRGIRVKVLIDGFSGFLDVTGSEWFKALASHENIELKIYAPLNLLKPWEIQTRLHDKYVIIDDKMYLLGGRNNTNLFLGDYPGHKNIDRELFIYEQETAKNSSLMQLKDYFEKIWALPESKSFECGKQTKKVKKAYEALTDRWQHIRETYPEGFAQTDWEEETFAVNKVTLLTNPMEAVNKEPQLWYALHQLMMQGQNVTIHTPYIICSDRMYEDLSLLCRTVQNVEIITNDITSGANPFGCTDYLNQKEKILDTGVTVHEYLGETSNHTKTVLIDERISIVGSYNLDMRSTYLDTEMMLVVDSPELNRILRDVAQENITYSKSISKGKDYVYGDNYVPREFSLGKKIYYGVLRVLIRPIRHLL